jgi:hypothetical protein
MKRSIAALVIFTLTAAPVMAQSAQSTARLTFGGVPLKALQAPTTTPPPAQAQANPPSVAAPHEGKALYIVTLAAAVGGTAYNIHTTREALDRRLSAKTFPLVWKTTRDPADKGKLTGIIAGLNGGLMVVGGIVFAKRHPGLATAINVIVAAATTGVALRNRNVINDDKKLHP